MLHVAVPGSAPAGHFAEYVNLHLIDKDPGANAKLLANALLGGCQ